VASVSGGTLVERMFVMNFETAIFALRVSLWLARI
jgi:hypothetical protein